MVLNYLILTFIFLASADTFSTSLLKFHCLLSHKVVVLNWTISPCSKQLSTLYIYIFCIYILYMYYVYIYVMYSILSKADYISNIIYILYIIYIHTNSTKIQLQYKTEFHSWVSITAREGQGKNKCLWMSEGAVMKAQSADWRKLWYCSSW